MREHASTYRRVTRHGHRPTTRPGNRDPSRPGAYAGQMSTPQPPPAPPPPPGGYGEYGEGDRGETAATAGPVVASVGGHPVAPAWKRIVARFLDGIIVNMIIGFIAFRAIAGEDAASVASTTDTDTDAGKVFLAAIVVLAVSFVWDAVATKLTGGTPMKRAFGMRVVQVDSGADVEWKHVIIRWGTLAIWSVIPVLSFFVPLILVIVSLVFLFSKLLRQAVWDLAAKTVVVEG